jgi:hypothetical protein
VNKGLERLTREQSLEIKSLRKQLRQSIRLSSIGPRSISPEEELSASEDESDGEDVDPGDVDFRIGLEKSLFLTEQMLTEAKKALEYRVRTSELPSGRVLSGDWTEKDL